MELVRRTLQLTSSLCLVNISEGLTLYIASCLEKIFKMFFVTRPSEIGRNGTMRHPPRIPPADVMSDNVEEFRERVRLLETGCVEGRALRWFMSLTSEVTGVMTPDDILLFCESINKSPVDIVFLVLAAKMQAKKAGVFTEKEWLRAAKELK
jgi:hypothetical protein